MDHTDDRSPARPEAGPAAGRRATKWAGARVRRIAIEGAALAVVLALTLIKLAAMEHSGWRTVLLSNGDSLTLPLVLQSLQRGEPFNWIFSSQTFFFPEIPVYVLCGLIAGTLQGGLVLNAIVNVVLLYAGFRAVAGAVIPGQRTRQMFVGLGAILLFLIAILTESDVSLVGVGTVEPSRIGTVFLLTTYYSGALLVGIGMLALALWAARGFAEPPRVGRSAIYGAVGVLVGAATTYSDPIYILWFVLPFGTALLWLLVSRRITLRWALVMGFPIIAGAGLGNTLRIVMPRFIAAGYEHYLTSFSAPESARMLTDVLREWMSSPQGVLRAIVVLAPILFTVVLFVRQFSHRRVTDPRRVSDVELLIMVLVIVSAITLVVGVIATGQSVTRYLVPLYVFPALSLLLIRRPSLARARIAARIARWRAARPRIQRPGVRRAAALLLAAATVASVGISIPSVASLATRPPAVDVGCLDDWLGGRALNGAGEFWKVRALTLYGAHTGSLVQVDPALNPQPWMNNLWLFGHGTFSYVVADDLLQGTTIVGLLGKPAATIDCSGYQIYDYSGMAGAEKLTTGIRTSYETFERGRSGF